MKPSLFWILAFGFIAASVIAEEVEEVQVEEDAESRSGVTQDKVSPRIHPLLHHHHGHPHLDHLHHAHHLHAFAHHHPILTKKLLLLKFKKLGLAAHHHLHHGHHHLHHLHHGHLHHGHLHHGHLHSLFDHGHHHHLHGLLHHHLPHHHLPHHHHLFRASPGVDSDSVVELIPISDTAGTLSEANAEVPQTNYQYIDDNQGIQAYAVPADYLEGQLQDDPELDNYEELSLEDVPESSPINKQLVTPEEGFDQSPVYLYAVPQQVELGRSVNRVNKNRRKFKN